MPFHVDLEQFVQEVLDAVQELPDSLVAELKERMLEADSHRKDDLRELLLKDEDAH